MTLFDDIPGYESSFGPKDTKPVKCHKCKWEGVIEQTCRQRYRSSPDSWDSLAG